MVLGLDAGPPRYKVGMLPTCDVLLSTNILKFILDLNLIFHEKMNYFKQFYSFSLDSLRRQSSEWGRNALLAVQQVWVSPEHTVCKIN